MAEMRRALGNSLLGPNMNEEITPKNANRLALGLARQRRIHYREAEAMLRSFTLKLVIDASSCRSVAFQAALLTAFNVGNRAFLGGVSVLIGGQTLTTPPAMYKIERFSDDNAKGEIR